MRRWLAILALGLVALGSFAPAPAADWYDADWGYRVEGEVDASQVDEAVDWIVVYLSNLPSAFWSNVKAAGADIRVTSGDGTTEVASYVLGFVDSGSSGTGMLFIDSSGWISASTNEPFYIYTGNSSASAYAAGDTYGQYATFDANTVALYPLSSLNNVAQNAYHLTANNTPTSGQTGPFEGTESYLFDDASSEYLSGSAPTTNWPLTVRGFVNMDSNVSAQVPFALSDSAATNDYARGLFSTHPRFQGTVIGAGGSGSVASILDILSTSTWYHVYISRDANTGTTTARVIGVNSATDATTVSGASFDSIGIGALIDSSVGDYFSGNLSMVSVHDEVLSANYMNTLDNAFEDSAFVIWPPVAEAYAAGVTPWVELTSISTGTGDTAWSNTTLALSLIEGAATTDIPVGDQSQQLLFTNAGSALDEVIGSGIDGVEVEIIATGEDGAGDQYLTTDAIRLIVGGSPAGTDKGTPGVGDGWSDAALDREAYGGATDTWGLSLSAAQVTASNFGVMMQFGNDDPDNALMSVYRVRMRVYYSPAAGSGDYGNFFVMFR